MDIPIYQVDAFASECFQGNPAAVVPLGSWLSDQLMQSIAQENNLSETAFFIPVSKKNNHFHIRWFTPTQEVKLCGHATLAAAYIVFHFINKTKKKDKDKKNTNQKDQQKFDEVTFDSSSGPLKVTQEPEGNLTMHFAKVHPEVATLPIALESDFKENLLACYQCDDLVILLDDVDCVHGYQPDFNTLAKIPARGISISAVSASGIVQSRFFAPRYGINEDPVTGSSFTYLTPLWSDLLNKRTINFSQGGARKGQAKCTLKDQNVDISGDLVIFTKGDMLI